MTVPKLLINNVALYFPIRLRDSGSLHRESGHPVFSALEEVVGFFGGKKTSNVQQRVLQTQEIPRELADLGSSSKVTWYMGYVSFQEGTLPETNSNLTPEKMVIGKRLSFWGKRLIFRCKLLVLGRVHFKKIPEKTTHFLVKTYFFNGVFGLPGRFLKFLKHAF